MDKNIETDAPSGPICQSCALPLDSPGAYGTEADGSPSPMYCRFCFQNGQFTDPAMTPEKMIEQMAWMMYQRSDMPELLAREVFREVIPHLKRWKPKKGEETTPRPPAQKT